MLLHIKPTARKDQLFRFKSNFIRYFQAFEKKEDPVVSALTDGIESVGDGIVESMSNLKVEIDKIRTKHTVACRKEISELLREVARQMDVPI